MKRPECIMENKFLSLKLNLINYQSNLMKVSIAVDAMGGDESPLKVIKGLNLFLQNNQDCKVFYFWKSEI